METSQLLVAQFKENKKKVRKMGGLKNYNFSCYNKNNVLEHTQNNEKSS